MHGFDGSKKLGFDLGDIGEGRNGEHKNADLGDLGRGRLEGTHFTFCELATLFVMDCKEKIYNNRSGHDTKAISSALC
jgi:hypothetical protein